MLARRSQSLPGAVSPVVTTNQEVIEGKPHGASMGAAARTLPDETASEARR
jgi:hypothetical protein